MRDRRDIPPVVLSIAGFDPSGGAGVLADVRTIAAFDCFPTAAITALTFQNTVEVSGIEPVTPESVRAQVMPLVRDFDIRAVKTGMLPTASVIREVARLCEEGHLPSLVIDPVLRSTSGTDLVDGDGTRALVDVLLIHAVLITPNIPEAERLTGTTIENDKDMERAAKILNDAGAKAVLIKGGHRAPDDSAVTAQSARARDLLFSEGNFNWFEEPWIPSSSTHGTGCVLSAAITALLAHDVKIDEAVRRAKRFVTEAIRTAPGIGKGRGPLNIRRFPREL